MGPLPGYLPGSKLPSRPVSSPGRFDLIKEWPEGGFGDSSFKTFENNVDKQVERDLTGKKKLH